MAKDESVPTTDTPEDDTSSSNVDGKPAIAIKVYAPFKIYFEDNGRSISAVNKTGPFDILPKHHNFLCMLEPCTLKIQKLDGTLEQIPIHRALMHVKANRVVVFMDV